MRGREGALGGWINANPIYLSIYLSHVYTHTHMHNTPRSRAKNSPSNVRGAHNACCVWGMEGREPLPSLASGGKLSAGYLML